MEGNKKDLTVKVACIQMDVKIGDIKGNLEKTREMILEASSKGAKIIVLPELCLSGYEFETREEAFSLSHKIPESEPINVWSGLAKSNDVYIVAGISELDDNKLYNSSVLIGPDGYIGTYRKLHLWGEEFLWFEPGNTGLPVFHTPIGRIAMIVCADQWFPETYRICSLQDADIICVPTNWVWHHDYPNDMRTMGPIITMAMANCNNLFVAAACRVGTERGVSFPGHSIIVNTLGFPLDKNEDSSEVILYGDCDFTASRQHHGSQYNSIKGDRRIDVYDKFLGYNPKIH